MPPPSFSPAAPPSGDAPSLAPVVALRDITVTFGSVVALENVDLSLPPGTRQAMVGENGAGKSTLMKVLFGQLIPDSGEILVGSEPQRFTSPADAIRQGIGMVHQHFELIPPFTVAENVVLGAETRGAGGVRLDRKAAEEAVAALAIEIGLPIDPRARVEELSVASQQRVEILKALYRRARILILDEPTAVLAPSEARDLWAATARLSQAGTTVVFITHKLDEVMAHADAVTVLRRGRLVFASPIGATTPAQLAQAMVGGGLAPIPLPLPPLMREGVQTETLAGECSVPDNPALASSAMETGFTIVTPSPINGGRGRGMGAKPSDGVRIPALSLQSLSVRGQRGEEAVASATLELFPGEIVGLAGVDGSGQVELIEVVVGLRRASGGTIVLHGRDITLLSVAERRAAGIGYVPEDRQQRAVVMTFACEENAVLGRHRETAFSTRGLSNNAALRTFLHDCVEKFDVRGAAVGLPISSLSGGNQQKLVMARELSRAPQVLLASQPTRGLDFAASAFVHDSLRRERDRGAAVLMQSLDLAEVLSLSDRVAVMLSGKIVAMVSRDEATEQRIGALMTGAQ